MTKDSSQLIKNDGPWYYEMHNLGFNFRITDIQCALGSNQLKKLDFIKKRQQIAHIYDKAFSNLNSCLLPKIQDNIEHAYHLYPLQLNFEKLSLNKSILFQEMNHIGINLQVHYIPIHLHPFTVENLDIKKVISQSQKPFI